MNPTESGLAAYAIRWLMQEIERDPGLAAEAGQEAAPATQENGSVPDVRDVAARLLPRLDRIRTGRRS